MHPSPLSLAEEECNWEQHAGVQSVRESASQASLASDIGRQRRKTSAATSKAVKTVNQLWPVSQCNEPVSQGVCQSNGRASSQAEMGHDHPTTSAVSAHPVYILEDENVASEQD